MSLLELSQKIAKPLPVRHRNPVVYVERARIYVAANQVIIRSKTRQVSLPVGSTACLMLGPGTSISNEAVKIIARRDTTILWAGGGGLPIHCISGNYKTPKNIILQAQIMADDSRRLECAKAFLRKRNDFLPTDIKQVDSGEINNCTSVMHVMLAEARWAKRFYREEMVASGIKVALSKVKLTNFFCYALVTPIIISLGFNPNLGIIHGPNRGGGLIFDVADLIKPVLAVRLAIEASRAGWTENQLKANILERYRDGGYQRRLVDVLTGIYGLDS